MSVDFSDYTGLVPAKTVVVLQMKLRPGEGTDNVLKKTKDGTGEGLDVEFTVLDGEYARRKFFAFLMVSGETENQKSMAGTNRAKLKLFIDSAKFLDPNDKSPEAHAKRTMQWRDFDGLRFLAEIGIEPGRDGFPDRNTVTRGVTRDSPAWNGRPPIDQVAPDYGSGPTSAPAPGASAAPQAEPQAAAPIVRPAWAS
jgi:hypothetical protein